jgi:hypothetical protein
VYSDIDITRLSPQDRREVEIVLGELEKREKEERYKADPWAWLCEQVWTVDEATQQMRRWPGEKRYLQELIGIFQEEKMIALPKSRRMMISWTISAWAVWNARYHPHHAVFLQSENEDKAAFLTDKRCSFIENTLNDKNLRRTYKPTKTAKGAIGRITYHDTGSYLYAIPQGDSVIRSYTPSIVVMDESEHQQEGREALVAALPLVEKGVQLILLGTSNGPNGVLAEICRGVGFVRWT